MAKSNIKVDIRELKAFAQKLKKAANEDLRKQYNIWLEALGMEFISIVQDEIIRLRVVETRRLLNSFSRGNSDCVFEITDQGMSLMIGTNVEYASWVNDGHQLANGRWWEGYHYFDISIAIFEKIVAASMERKVKKWLEEL